MERLENDHEGGHFFLMINPNYNVFVLYSVTKFSESCSVNNKWKNIPRVMNEDAQIGLLAIFSMISCRTDENISQDCKKDRLFSSSMMMNI